MEVNRMGADIIIRFDNQQEAAALHSVLTGQAHTIDPRAAEFGNWMYGWFFEQIQRLALQYDKETAGVTKTLSPRSYIHPRQGTIRSFP